MEDRYEYLNQPFEGILLYSENGKLCHKLVAGSERPNLLCKDMFVNLTHMGRPYPDDIAEGIQKALTPQEEQEKQAEAGDQELMESFSIGYLRGINGCEENPEKTFYWTKKLAETGRADYQFNIGLYYAKGHGVKRDFRKAIEWEQKAQANSSLKPSLKAEMQIALAVINYAKGWDTEDESGFWRYITAQFGYRDESGQLRNLLCNCVKDALVRNNRWFVINSSGNQFKSSIVAHAFSTKRSWLYFCDFLFDFYKTNLDWEYIEDDPMIARTRLVGGSLFVGDVNELRFLKSIIQIDTITFEDDTKYEAVKIRPCYIDQIEYQGIRYEGSEDRECPIYTGVMYFVSDSGKRHEYSYEDTIDEKGHRLYQINPVRIVFINDRTLSITHETGDPDEPGDGFYYYRYFDKYAMVNVHQLTDWEPTRFNRDKYYLADLYSYTRKEV